MQYIFLKTAAKVFRKPDARCEPPRHSAVPVSKKQEVLKLLHPSTSSRTDRGAIRPYSRRYAAGIRKSSASHKTLASLYTG